MRFLVTGADVDLHVVVADTAEDVATEFVAVVMTAGRMSVENSVALCRGETLAGDDVGVISKSTLRADPIRPSEVEPGNRPSRKSRIGRSRTKVVLSTVLKSSGR